MILKKKWHGSRMLKEINTTNKQHTSFFLMSFPPMLSLSLSFFCLSSWPDHLFSHSVYYVARIFFSSLFFISFLCLLCFVLGVQWDLALAWFQLWAPSLASLCFRFSPSGVLGSCPCCRLEPGGKEDPCFWGFWFPIQWHCIVWISLKKRM